MHWHFKLLLALTAIATIGLALYRWLEGVF